MIYNIHYFTACYDDMPDQQIGFSTCKQKTCRWIVAGFFCILDVARDELNNKV